MRGRQLLKTLGWALLAAGSAAAATLEWSELRSLPRQAGSDGAFVAVVGGRLLVAGGIPVSGGGAPTDRAWLLDSPDGDWEETTSLPRPTAFGASASFGGVAIFTGGLAGDSLEPSAATVLARFEGGSLAYVSLPLLPRPAAQASGAVLDGVLYVAGGRTPSSPAGSDNAVWSLALTEEGGAWRREEPLPGPGRLQPALVAVEDALYLFGGRRPGPAGDTGEPLAGGYRYQPDHGWKLLAPSPEGQGILAAAPLGPTHVALFRASETAAAYHTVTDTWVVLDGARTSPTPQAALAWNGAIALLGSGLPSEERGSPVAQAALAPQTSEFSPVDYVTLGCYLLVLVMMGLYFAGKGSNTEDFFLAGRRMPWWATGLSIFGTQLSSISFMAVPAKVYATDWVYFLLQMTIVMVAFPVVFLYLPHFRRQRMTSAYEYLEARFNLPVRLYASLSFVLYQLGRMAIVLFLPAIALTAVTGIDVYSCILVMGVMATAYTVIGGIKAVIWTDVVQVFVLYGGALLSLIVLILSLDGGLSGIVSAGLEYDKFHMFNWTWDWTTTAVWVVLVGNLFMNLVPYTSDQAVVQRYFTTRDEKAAARSIWTNAVLLVPSTLTLFLLGTGLWAFYRAHPELLNPALPTDSIFPLFISQQLPAGIAGLLIAGVFAASMSTLDSSLNSVAAALVTDFYARFRPDSGEAARLKLARWLTAGLGATATAASIALATFDIGSLWDAFQGMMGLLGGGLAGLFALGIFFKRANGRGAMTGAVASVAILYWVQQHTELHFFLYGAVGVLSCVAVGALASSLLPRAAR